MYSESELIFLDAVVTDVISLNAFRAELSNGHRFVAWCARSEAENFPCRTGEKVRVRFSPYDFSTGEVIGKV